MNNFEKLLLGLLAAVPSTVPVFIHSPHGIAIANASEILLASVLQQFAAQPAATTAPAPTPVPPIAQATKTTA
jgi:hypothetical protein